MGVECLIDWMWVSEWASVTCELPCLFCVVVAREQRWILAGGQNKEEVATRPVAVRLMLFSLRSLKRRPYLLEDNAFMYSYSFFYCIVVISLFDTTWHFVCASSLLWNSNLFTLIATTCLLFNLSLSTIIRHLKASMPAGHGEDQRRISLKQWKRCRCVWIRRKDARDAAAHLWVWTSEHVAVASML